LSVVNEPSDKLNEEEEREPRQIKRLPNVLCRNGLVLFEGTLVLTPKNINLINAHPANVRKDAKLPESKSQDEEASETVTDNRPETKEKPMAALSIPLPSIESMTYEMTLGQPSLLLKWNDDKRSFGKSRKTQFIQREEGSKDDRIVNWIPIIDEMSIPATASAQPINEETAPITPSEQLEPKILEVLNEREWKGSFQIATELRDKYGSKCDFDQVETLCIQLAKKKLVEEDKVGGFFKKAKKSK
jgi:hypothetical protein